MLDIKIVRDRATGDTWLETSISGKPLLTTPQLNKGTAFTRHERDVFHLTGKLPIQIETLAEQVQRAYAQYLTYRTKLKKNIFLNTLHDLNQVLFYELVRSHLSEMLPVIYTPIVGKAVKKFSQEFRTPRGLYIAYPEIDYVEKILDNRSNPDIDLIVVTDGEGVLGIGDQGIGGMDIPIAKLMVYTLCGGIDPTRTLPILLDVGTNNETLLNDPLYLGWRNRRIQGEEYDRFVDKFIAAIEKKFPHVFLHWEDFGRANAQRYLQRYEGRICTFNDDIQGTGIVTLAALLSAIAALKATLSEQRIVIFGAGTAGCGIASQIFTGMQHQQITPGAAKRQFWLIDQAGLLIDDMSNLTPAQQRFARSRDELARWTVENPHHITLKEVVENVKPTVLIGCSAMAGAFDQALVTCMMQHTKRPIIFPLSNPTERAEATPADLMTWTQGQVLVATGSPFAAVTWNQSQREIAQCNNALAFPGIGLGILAVKAKKLTERMIWAAVETLAKHSPILENASAPLLPALSQASVIAKQIAIAVAREAIDEDIATINQTADLPTLIEELFWEPRYLPYRPSKRAE